MTSPIIFDVESGPAPDAIEFLPEVEAPSNYKDPAKIEAYREQKRVEMMEAAALSPVTGQILAIGIRRDGEFYAYDGDERSILSAFWRLIAPKGVITQRVVGFNSNRFDLPFCIRRSWKLGVEVPRIVMQGRYLNSQFVDIMETWQAGDRMASVKLDTLARWLGVGAKNGSGADFAKLFAEDREKALQYLENDLLITEKVAVALGVLAADEVAVKPDTADY